MHARLSRWLVALWLATPASWAGPNDWDVTLSGTCHEMRPGVGEDEDSYSLPPTNYYERTQEYGCFTMGSTPTLSWDFSELLTFGEVGVIIRVSATEFDGYAGLQQVLWSQTYGTLLSPLSPSSSQALPAFEDYISHVTIGWIVDVFFRYSGSGWNYSTSRNGWFLLSTVLDAPVDPQAVVWRNALGLSAYWMRYCDNDADAVRQLVKRSWGVRYDGDTPYIDDGFAVWIYDPIGTGRAFTYYGDDDEHFALSQWIDQYAEYEVTLGECADVATHLVTLAATVGVDADPVRVVGPVYYDGGTRWSGWTSNIQDAGAFNYHEVLELSHVYDGAIAFPDEYGVFYVCYGNQDEARVDIVLDWAYSSWIPVLCEPDPEELPEKFNPGLVIYWPSQ